jgi:transcriptional regulator with XRE-family HTH domain
VSSEDESGAQSAGNADVGSAVRQARERAGLTQTALAERLGTTQTCISYWETGKRDMGAADLVKAAAALGVPAASLLPGQARDLPPLPEYTCGQCGETFGTNCDPDDIECTYCEAKRCPHCQTWFGSEF